MKEPQCDDGTPYSSLTNEDLKNFAAGLTSTGCELPVGYVNPIDPEFYSASFRCWYAAYILQSRGQT